MKKTNTIASITGFLALTTIFGCSVKTVRFDTDKIYYGGVCSTSELQLNSDSSFYFVNTICDIAAYNVIFGKYGFKGDSVLFTEDIEYYFSRNSIIKESECEDKMVTFHLKEHYPLHYGSNLTDYCMSLLVIGESSGGEIDTIPRGAVTYGKKDDEASISISADKITGYDKI
jgi:hypothetical protein